MAVLTDPDREFVASDFLRLEVIPKAAYNQQVAEEAFYQRYFDAVVHWCDVSAPLITLAQQSAARYGLSAIDAIHVATAQTMAADELVTAEPRHRRCSAFEGFESHRFVPSRVESVGWACAEAET